ncbi:hypothetical protein GQ54DRAFT_298449 [Martensiomyces pterosporus]|nr:hypothetical protein GQ54DRAFT_298449 [Martensiomyces pterosporus]
MARGDLSALLKTAPGAEIQSCDEISHRQQRLLMQCYCKKTYNTEFVKYYRAKGEVVCNRMDKHMYKFNATLICQDYRRYRCRGVHIRSSDASRVSMTKLLLAAFLLLACLFTQQASPH